MKGLTARQRQVLQFIEGFIEKFRYSPSYNEIKAEFGFSSLGSVYKHIQVLKRKGHLNGERGCSRSLSPSQQSPTATEGESVMLPFVGTLSAGSPIDMFLKGQDLAIPPQFVRNVENSYILQACGDDFLSEFIADGDLIIVEALEEAQPGDTILGMVHGDESIIRRYYPEGIYVRLEGRHPDAPPIVVPEDELIIQGVLISVLRLLAN